MSETVHQRRSSRPSKQETATTSGQEVDTVSGLVDLPQGFPDEPAHVVGKRRGRQNLQSLRGTTGSSSLWVIPFGLLMVGVLVGAYIIITSYHRQAMLDQMKDKEETLTRAFEDKYAALELEKKQLKSQVEESYKQKVELDQLREKEETLARSLGETREALKQEKKELQSKIEESNQLRVQIEKDGDLNGKLRQALEQRIDRLTKYKTQMQENIQLMSKNALLEKFGPGPHRVDIVVQFDPDFPKLADSDEEVATIVIELAPVNELPHVVYWFLEQVSRGLYDGCSFHRNAGHVVQGGPKPNFLSPPNPDLQKRFKDSGFVSVLFQEYSAKFPHVKYTLGFAGRPGGPDFYISTMDNSVNHGPGGQTSYEDPTEADPCFAKVVEGFNVVDRIQLSPVEPGWYKAMVHNVAIRSMKITSKGDSDHERGENLAVHDVQAV